MEEAWIAGAIALIGAGVGSLLSWLVSRAAYNRQRADAARDRAEQTRLARAIVLAAQVPRLLQILQDSIDAAKYLDRAIPDNRETGYDDSYIPLHRDARRGLELDAPHPAHSLAPDLRDRWAEYASAYALILEFEVDDDLDPNHIVSVTIHHDRIKNVLSAADDLCDLLHEAERCAGEAKATLRAV